MPYIVLTAALAIVLSLAQHMVGHPAIHLATSIAWGVLMFTVHNRVSLRRGYTVATTLAFLTGLVGCPMAGVVVGLQGFAIGFALILVIGIPVALMRNRGPKAVRDKSKFVSPYSNLQ